MTDTNLKLAISTLRDNNFTRSYYAVDIGLDDVLYSLLRFLNRDLAKKIQNGSNEDIKTEAYTQAILSRIPIFQRENDKWTPDMQSTFVRNLLMGYKPSPILFYNIESEDSRSNCKVLDGLQRITSIIRFFTDPLMTINFGNNVVCTSEELLRYEPFQRTLWNLTIPLRIFTFKDDYEACEFYIDMNENITHSSDDILRAKRFLETK